MKYDPKKFPTLKQLMEDFLLTSEEIKTLLRLPREEQDDFLTERALRVTIMQALIESGVPEEKARGALTEPNLFEIVEEDQYGNEIVKKMCH